MDKKYSVRAGSKIICGASVAGKGHRNRGIPCQDAWGAAALADDAVIMVVADGFGSAAHGGDGAETAVAAAIGSVKDFFEPAGAQEDVSALYVKNREIVRSGIDAAHAAICAVAAANGHLSREYACTLILVLWFGTSCTAGQIGDGGVVVRTPGGLACISSPQKGEYVNETYSLAAPGYAQHLRIVENVPCTSACALFTDGVERSLLLKKGAEWKPYGPFFSPAFIYLDTLSDTTGCGDEIASFLQSERMQNQSDDDMTLVMGIATEGTCDDETYRL
jgi:hypothetical protein